MNVDTIQSTNTEHGPKVSLVFEREDESRAYGECFEKAGFPVENFPAGHALLRSVTSETTGCVVASANLPDMPGVALPQELRRLHAVLPVLLVVDSDDAHGAVQAFRAGAADVLERPVDSETLVSAVKSAVSRNVILRKAECWRTELTGRMERLTPRERHVLDLVVAGYPNKRIAAVLDRSQKTIEIHRSHVMRKMQVGSLAELVQAVIAVRGIEGISASAPPEIPIHTERPSSDETTRTTGFAEDKWAAAVAL